MDLIKFQYSEPKEILNTDSHTFALIIHQKIYKVNSNFHSNQQCLLRMIGFINGMETSVRNLKIAKNMVSAFQSSILFFLKDFYHKSDEVFSKAFFKQKSDNETMIKKKEKYVILLSQIASMYKSLINGVGDIQEFRFLTKYATKDKEKMLVKSETEFKYLKFLKKCFDQEIKMKDPNVRPMLKLNILEVLEKQLRHIFKDSTSWHLEKITLNKIIDRYRLIIDTTKHAERSFHKNHSVLNGLKEKQSQGLFNEEDLQFVNKILPCCRTFFYQNEPIHHAQSFTLEYKNYQSPYDNFCLRNLKKAICGFLNREGGIILVGIMERQDKFKLVKGQFLSQNEKEEVLKEYRAICGQISPDIIGQGKYRVKFVPIKSGNRKFIAGKYIIRVEVAAGNYKSLYTYKDNKDQYVAIRTANQVLRKQINQETLLRFKQKLLHPMKISPIHEKPCPDPEIGQPIWQSGFKKNKNQKDSDGDSSDKQKKKKKKNWTEKMEQAAFSRKDKKALDFVYFSQKPTLSKSQQQNQRILKFICDDENDSKKKNIEQEKEEQEEYEGDLLDLANNDKSLDFQPLNPISKRGPRKPAKKVYKEVSKQQNIQIEEPNTIHIVPYKLDKALEIQETNQVAMSETKSLDILIVGYPFHMIVKDIQNYDISLVQPPIKCNNELVTWLKMKVLNEQFSIKYQLFNRAMMKKHQQMNTTKKLRTRKVFENLIFGDQVFLNKLIHKYRHNQEFTDNKGCIYYKFKNNLEAITAYVMGWEMNIPIKFISNTDFKNCKKDYLRLKHQSKL